jgi:hypothetical protein
LPDSSRSISDPFDRTDDVEEGRFSESERALDCGWKIGRLLPSNGGDTSRYEPFPLIVKFTLDMRNRLL